MSKSFDHVNMVKSRKQVQSASTFFVYDHWFTLNLWYIFLISFFCNKL